MYHGELMTRREKMEDVLAIVLALAAFYVLWTAAALADASIAVSSAVTH
jgi:hypothetical protein|tara:strand:+ start:1025 stop:1171 length:147 start_codon:yes stop_codon:yes gene_type:complete